MPWGERALLYEALQKAAALPSLAQNYIRTATAPCCGLCLHAVPSLETAPTTPALLYTPRGHFHTFAYRAMVLVFLQAKEAARGGWGE
jgi:hypothetical protein